MSIKVNRKPILFTSEPKRVITRFFFPTPESRVESILQKVSKMPDKAAMLVLNQTLRDFSGRHRNVSKIYRKHFEMARQLVKDGIIDMSALPEIKQLLIGAYFTSEYSIESAAFFNPSMVEDPDQTGLRIGEKRVVISFRATGEGHVSSIVFRGGILDENNNLHIIPTGRLVEEAEMIRNYVYHREDFSSRLKMRLQDHYIVDAVLSELSREFDYYQLHRVLDERIANTHDDEDQKKLLRQIKMMGEAYYHLSFSLDTGISDRVIFPITAEERNGIEDARFVKFTGDDGLVSYYATYSAYDGRDILPRLIETRDFYNFRILPIHGEQVQNKGMALFPRKIGGKYAMLARVDGVNNYIVYGEEISIWGTPVKIQEPIYPWEFIQVGNCGSPIETPYGWLVITHGVGTMRKYCLGAILLDLHDPTIVIGALSEPLITPNEEEREGYVPNVVYSCGSIINGHELVIPYAMSDTASTYATVSLHELMELLLPANFMKGNNEKTPVPKILVVDDEVVNQQLITYYLKQAGYDAEVAPDGIAALMKIGREKFDLILSDIAMPGFDGYQLLEYLSKNGFDIPVMLITGTGGQFDEIKSRAMGAVDFLYKPIDKKLLLERVQEILKATIQDAVQSN